MIAGRPKVAFYWCASCGGCEEAVIDLGEAIVDVAHAVDIVFWPAAMDFKRTDVEAIPDGSITATFLNGAIRTNEQEEMAHLLRRKSRSLVAFGACAQLGGIPGLANLFDQKEIIEAVYLNSPSTVNPQGVLPATHQDESGCSLKLPEFCSLLRTLDQVVNVDYYVPGCPPTARLLRTALQTVLSDDLPPRGSVLAPDYALCEECPRKDSKPERLSLPAFKRPQEIIIDEQECLLAQGLLCLGPATRAGCEAPCIRGNMPCSGCGGPTSRVKDQGGKALSFVATLLDSKEEAEVDRILSAIPDPVGSFYRYGLPGSLLRAKRQQQTAEPVAATPAR